MINVWKETTWLTQSFSKKLGPKTTRSDIKRLGLLQNLTASLCAFDSLTVSMETGSVNNCDEVLAANEVSNDVNCDEDAVTAVTNEKVEATNVQRVETDGIKNGKQVS